MDDAFQRILILTRERFSEVRGWLPLRKGHSHEISERCRIAEPRPKVFELLVVRLDAEKVHDVLSKLHNRHSVSIGPEDQVSAGIHQL